MVVDDEVEVRRVLAELLAGEGLRVVEAADGRAGLALALAEAPTVAILDIAMPEVDGLALLEKLRGLAPELPVIMLTGSDDARTAVEAMRLGAYDYLTKPFDHEELILHVRRALERQALRSEVSALRSQLTEPASLRALMGPSRAVEDLILAVGRVASSPFTVLVQGETGTGKELVARAIHQRSPRHGHAFIALDCGALPESLIESEMFGYDRGAFTGAERRREGRFELATGGTLFLDEVANLSLTTQAKLLRALQERSVWPLGGKAPVSVDVRVIAASNTPLEAEVQAGRFRRDLYYRLNEFTLTLPPLRSRREDIPFLANRFLGEASMELRRTVVGFSPGAEALLVAHAWPGNVRELRNVVRRAVLLSTDRVEPEHLDILAHPGGRNGSTPLPGPGELEEQPTTLKEARERGAAEAERRAIRWALRAARGNKSEAARLLRTDYKTLHVKVKQYDLRARDFVPS
jgi:DNA-binding NtrC family response regulator